jgi:recombination protein RecA
MFSVMALPAALADISLALVKAGVSLGGAPGTGRREAESLPFGLPAVDQALPDGGILRGGVVELMVPGASGLGTALSLAAVRSVQTLGKQAGLSESTPWCAFVDASSSLYAPGVEAMGIELERLLVVRPQAEGIGRAAIKLAESGVFGLVVVDTVGALGAELDVSLKSFGRVVRRLSMAVDGTQNSVLLLTSSLQPRALPLPVAQRLELAHPTRDRLVVRVAKDRRGRVTPPRSIVWGPRQSLSGVLDERKLA